MISAALYAACSDTETPRTLKDISAISNIKKKDLARCYRILYKEPDLRMPVVDPVKCVSRIASQSGSSRKNKEKRALDILRRAEETQVIRRERSDGICCSSTLRCLRHGE